MRITFLLPDLGMRGALRRVVTDAPRRARLAARGVERIRELDIRATAANHLRALAGEPVRSTRAPVHDGAASHGLAGASASERGAGRSPASTSRLAGEGTPPGLAADSLRAGERVFVEPSTRLEETHCA